MKGDLRCKVDVGAQKLEWKSKCLSEGRDPDDRTLTPRWPDANGRTPIADPDLVAGLIVLTLFHPDPKM